MASVVGGKGGGMGDLLTVVFSVGCRDGEWWMVIN